MGSRGRGSSILRGATYQPAAIRQQPPVRPYVWLAAVLLLLGGMISAWAEGPGPASKDVPEEPAPAATHSAAGEQSTAAPGLPGKGEPVPHARSTVGEPLAPGMMELLRDEIVARLQTRGDHDRFARFQSYAGGS